MKTRAEEAISLFTDKHYNCAQAILAAYGPEYGIDRTAALKVASVFGGGMCRTGATCGSVTGALMVLSLRYCDGRPKGLLEKPVHRKARKFIREYEKAAGTLNCNALRGHDPMKGRYVKGGNERCPALVELACKLLEEML